MVLYLCLISAINAIHLFIDRKLSLLGNGMAICLLGPYSSGLVSSFVYSAQIEFDPTSAGPFAPVFPTHNKWNAAKKPSVQKSARAAAIAVSVFENVQPLPLCTHYKLEKKQRKSTRAGLSRESSRPRVKKMPFIDNDDTRTSAGRSRWHEQLLFLTCPSRPCNCQFGGPFVDVVLCANDKYSQALPFNSFWPTIFRAPLVRWHVRCYLPSMFFYECGHLAIFVRVPERISLVVGSNSDESIFICVLNRQNDLLNSPKWSWRMRGCKNIKNKFSILQLLCWWIYSPLCFIRQTC